VADPSATAPEARKTKARRAPLRIGHKGADAIVLGNTIESFRTAVALGAEVIELDVVRPRADFANPDDWRRAPPGPAPDATEPLLVAHDWGDTARREALTLAEVLDAFAEPPLDRVEIDLDLKIAGREDEIVAAIRERGLDDRTMASTMELASLAELRRLAPELRIGWTLPRTTRDWTRYRWARPLVAGGLASLRARLPGIVRRRAPGLGIWSIWVYHAAITPRLIAAAHAVDVAVVAWTVDDPERVRALTDAGVDGIRTNDPRLLGP
jgi:glycerophosphoryl diester phosphodiesterase